MENLQDFFKTLYAGRPRKSHILISQGTRTGLKNKWFREIPRAVEYVTMNPNRCTWFQVGLGRDDYGRQRCHTDELQNRPVIALPGVFADIDVEHPVHKKKDLPKTVEDAKAIVYGHGYDPTITIDSGHGLQCYWLFHEIWKMYTPAERYKAIVLLRRFRTWVQFKAERAGYTIDSVQDLVRILRVPFSYNCKDKEHIVPVNVIEFNDGNRWDPADWDEVLPEDPGEYLSKNKKLTDSRTIHAHADGLVLDEDAMVPAAKFMDLVSIYGAQFSGAFDNTRKDLKDKSPSGYDQAIATMAAQAGWTSQEIAYLMIAHRQKNSHDLKLHNRQYYSRTIMTAKEAAAAQSIETERIQKDEAFMKEMEEPEIQLDERLAQVSLKLRIKVIKILKYLGDEGTYVLVTSKGNANLGRPETLLKQDKFRVKVFDQIKHLIPKIKPKEWDDICAVFTDLIEDVPVSDESTMRGQINAWLEEYIGDQDRKWSIEDGVDGKRPFFYENQWWVFLDSLAVWIKTKKGMTLKRNDITLVLKQLGAQNKPINMPPDKDGKRKKIRVWALGKGKYGA